MRITRKRIRIIIIVLCAFITGIWTTRASSKSLEAGALYTIQNGLSQTLVTCVVQDSKGFVWIGTVDGLNRFDGYDFVVYRHHPDDSFSISDNYIRTICEGVNGDIWIGNNEGLNRLERSTSRFISYNLGSDYPISQSKTIFKIAIDNDKNLWAKTRTGIIRLNINSGKVVAYDHLNDEFTYSDPAISFPVFIDSKGSVWVGTKDGLNYFNKDLELFQRYVNDVNDPFSISDNIVKTIFEDKQGVLWIGTRNGLNKMIGQNRFERFLYSEPKKDISCIFQDKTGMMWVGCRDGLVSFNSSENNFTFYNKLVNNNREYLCTGISDIYEDRSHVLWICSYEGLIKVDKKSSKFNLYRNAGNEPRGFSSNTFSSILVDKTGLIFLGTRGAGLNIFDRKRGTVVSPELLHNSNGNHSADENVYSLFRDSKGLIWIGTDNGVFIYNPETRVKNTITQISPKVDANVFRNNRVNKFIEDIKGNIWIATNKGLHVYNRELLSLKSSYKIFYNDLIIPLTEINCIIQDGEGFVWMGTNNGLIKYDPGTGMCMQFQRKGLYSGNGISSNHVFTLYDQDSILWIGTAYGLNRLDKKLSYIRLYSERSGLPNNKINSIEQDSHGTLWISTNKGLVSFDPFTEVFKPYDVVDGLQGYEFLVGSSFKTDEGEIFFGGLSGLNSFYPDSMRSNSYLPEINITSIEFISKDGLRRIAIDKLDKIEIPPGVKIVTIYFSAHDFTHPEKNNYAYRLARDKSKNSEWIYLGNHHTATFTNLSEGNYVFQVKGSNNDLQWNEEGSQLIIVVKVPWYKSRIAVYFFYVFGILFFISMVYFWTRNLRSANKILRDKEAASKLVAQQKEELAIINKDLTDSINYAKRIQDAMMPPHNLFGKLFKDSFVYFRPKNIVSGDFYWINESNGKIFVASVDCTGHGVPGAFMSLIGIELFRRITNIRGIEQPAQILNILNDNFAGIFSDEGGLTIKDGMDVALCVFDKNNSTVEFAGAVSQVYVIRDKKIIEIKGDRYSIGINVNDARGERFKYNNNKMDLRENDCLYIFSDGFVDQFGGPIGKKYKKRRFRHLLLNIHEASMKNQMEMIDRSFNDWKGNLEQIDDILVIGIKP